MGQRNSTFTEKLRNYSILSGVALAAAGKVDAQIEYHLISPDTVLDTNRANYAFDLNGDGIMDFDIQKFSKTNFSLAGIRLKHNSASLCGSIVSGKEGFPFAFAFGAQIKGNNYWLKYSSSLSGNYSKYEELASFNGKKFGGNWGYGEHAKFIALRLATGSHYNYGWVRCSLTPGGKSITIFDYAYQLTPDLPIITGDTGTATGVNPIQLENISVNASGKNVFVKYPNADVTIEIVIENLLGQAVKTVETTNKTTEINMGNSATGIYNVIVKYNTSYVVNKVFIY